MADAKEHKGDLGTANRPTKEVSRDR